MADPLVVSLSLVCGFFVGLATGMYYLKNKMLGNLGSDELNPNQMMDDLENMLGDLSDGDPEMESNNENPSEKIDDILGDQDE